MKNIKTSISLLFFISIMVLVSCKKDAYVIEDGGIANDNTDLSTYDYLKSHQYHYFDTLIMIIDHFNLKDTINNAGTFFAPTDYSLNSTINFYNDNLDSLYKHVTSKFITQYCFSDTTLTLNNAKTTTVLYKNWADTTNGLKKTAYTETVVSSVFSYYILQYVKINGKVDPASGTPEDGDLPDAVLNCQTTGIKTSTGTNLNVFSNNSSLTVR